MYRDGHEKREELRKQIEDQLDTGIMEPAQGEWRSHILVAPRKGGKMLICVDFGRLNSITIPGTCQHLRRDDYIYSFTEDKMSTMLNSLRGYWKVPITEKDRDKSTFTSHRVKYRYKGM